MSTVRPAVEARGEEGISISGRWSQAPSSSGRGRFSGSTFMSSFFGITSLTLASELLVESTWRNYVYLRLFDFEQVSVAGDEVVGGGTSGEREEGVIVGVAAERFGTLPFAL